MGRLLDAVTGTVGEVSLVVVLLLAGVGSLIVLELAAALTRRRSRSYLLVDLVLATLAGQTAVAGRTITRHTTVSQSSD